MTLFTTDLDELVSNIEALSFTVDNITRSFSTTPLFSPMLSEQVAGKKNIDLEKRERIFQTTTPVFIRRIDFIGEAYKSIELCLYTSEGKSKALTVEVGSRGGWVIVNEFCSKFSIRSKGVLARPKLSTINIYGFDFTRPKDIRSTLVEFASAAYKVTAYVKEAKETVAALEVKHETLSDEIDEYADVISKQTKDSADLDVAIKKGKKNLDELESESETVKAGLGTVVVELQAKQNNLQQLTRETRNLNDGVADLKQQLSGLVNDRSLISDEFSDYIKEGKGQAAVYLKLMVIPAFVIGLGIAVIFNGAGNFLSAHYVNTADVVAAFILRIPFAAVVGGAIYYSWRIAQAFMVKIFSIQEERLALAKLLILAKNTVFSTAEDLGIDPAEKFHMRTRLKIEMLKSHLAKDLGSKINMSELDTSNKSEAAPAPALEDEVYNS